VNLDTCQIKTGHPKKLGNIKKWPNLKRIKLKIGQLKKLAKLITEKLKIGQIKK
jgi:hypothetical protein